MPTVAVPIRTAFWEVRSEIRTFRLQNSITGQPEPRTVRVLPNDTTGGVATICCFASASAGVSASAPRAIAMQAIRRTKGWYPDGFALVRAFARVPPCA